MGVTLLERAARPGGRARSREHDGWIFNQGAHALYRGGAAEQVLGELGVRLTAVSRACAALRYGATTCIAFRPARRRC